MKKLFSIAVLLTLVVSAFAQKQKSKPDAIKEIATLTNSKKPDELEKGYQLCKDFLQRFGTDTDDAVVKIKKFVESYRNDKFLKAVDGGKYADGSALGKEILAEQPENVDVKINLAYMGYNAATKGDRAYVPDTVDYAGKAIQAIDAGTMPKSFAPFKEKDETLGWLHYMIGSLMFDKDMKTYVGDVYKATQYESSIKHASVPYYMIVTYYESIYEKMTIQLRSKSPRESDYKDFADATDKAVDRMLDAYARLCIRAEAEKNPSAGTWKARLTQIYTFRKKSDAGLAEFISAAEKSPFPDPSKL